MFADAEAYERFMGRWSRLVAPRFVDFTDVPDQGRVLDVGSGTGALAFTLAERKPRSHVLGIDPSKEYVAYANSRNLFPDRARFETGDAQQLRFADASFDASLSLLVFNFIPDPESLAGAAPRHKTGGPDRSCRLGLWRWDADAPSVLGWRGEYRCEGRKT